MPLKTRGSEEFQNERMSKLAGMYPSKVKAILMIKSQEHPERIATPTGGKRILIRMRRSEFMSDIFLIDRLLTKGTKFEAVLVREERKK